MKTYLVGVIVALVMNMVRLVVAAIASSSHRIRNIEKLGLHYNITEGQCTKQKPTWAKVTFYLVDLLAITPLLSWLYVCYSVFALVKARINRAPLPEKIKEINHKLSSANLPREIVKECMNEIARFYGGEGAGIDDRNPYEDEYDMNTYVIASGSGRHEWNVHLELDKKNRSFTIIARDPDFGEHITTCEYKFEDTELLTRTIEAKHKYPDYTEYDIRNGVVMENEFRDRQKNSIFSSPEEVEERVQKLRAEINWENNANQAFRYFILFRHDDLLNDKAAKRFFQSEHERITSGFRRLEERVKNLGCSIVKSEFIKGNDIHCEPKDIPEESLAEIRGILNGNGLARYGISYAEFSGYEQLIQEIKLYLSRL
jgi:hypothetical protein